MIVKEKLLEMFKYIGENSDVNLNSQISAIRNIYNDHSLAIYIYSVSRFNPELLESTNTLKQFNLYGFQTPRELLNDIYLQAIKKYFIDDISVNDKLSTIEISALARNFNVTKGMYSTIDSSRTETVIIKATISDKNSYSNNWIIPNKTIEYYFEVENDSNNALRREYQKKPNSILYWSFVINNPVDVHLFYRNKKGEKYIYDGKYVLTSIKTDGLSGIFTKRQLVDDQTIKEYNQSIELESINLKDFNANSFLYKEYMTKQRLKQGVFRDSLIKLYGDECLLCNVKGTRYLLASHIKPYSLSSSIEAANPNNGLLLCPNHDKLFDLGLISFDNNGELIESNITIATNLLGNVSKSLPDTYKNNKYMKFHREKIFISNE